MNVTVAPQFYIGISFKQLSVVFEDKDKARETLSQVREFIKNNKTIYCSTHCPEGYLNIEQHKIMEL